MINNSAMTKPPPIICAASSPWVQRKIFIRRTQIYAEKEKICVNLRNLRINTFLPHSGFGGLKSSEKAVLF